jgi:guanosine-3',5'-bis(diphosphate) 3'-pyrophosphohydrolase
MTVTFLATAERLARSAHLGQVEKLTGRAYAEHLVRVAALVEGDEAKAVAWLHDTLEDTALTVEDLRAAGLPESVIRAVLILTHDRLDTYAEYIRCVAEEGNALALAVKLADLRDHLRPMEPVVLPPGMHKRYAKALAILEGRW